MDQSILSFYRCQSSLPPCDPVTVGPPEEAVGTPPGPGSARPPVQRVNECSHAAVTGCRRVFRSKQCCYAVQDHLCNPPRSLLPSFVNGDHQVTMAQVYIAQGCHL